MRALRRRHLRQRLADPRRARRVRRRRRRRPLERVTELHPATTSRAVRPRTRSAHRTGSSSRRARRLERIAHRRSIVRIAVRSRMLRIDVANLRVELRARRRVIPRRPRARARRAGFRARRSRAAFETSRRVARVDEWRSIVVTARRAIAPTMAPSDALAALLREDAAHDGRVGAVRLVRKVAARPARRRGPVGGKHGVVLSSEFKSEILDVRRRARARGRRDRRVDASAGGGGERRRGRWECVEGKRAAGGDERVVPGRSETYSRTERRGRRRRTTR